MKTIIDDLYPMNRCLLGEGYDNALLYIDKLIPLDVLKYESGTQVGTWTVPDEWVVHDAWVTKDGQPFLDYKTDPLSLVVGSLPFKGTISLEEIKKNLHYSDEQPSAFLYEFKFYDKDWGFSIPKNRVYKAVEVNPTELSEPLKYKNIELLEEGEYEVMIDTEYRPGTMKIGVHTIPGKTDKEILLFAHLDHPYQANDNLSGVAVLIDLVKDIKPFQLEHTVKLIFCPETIGSIAYATTQDLSKVEFVIALDAVGNAHEGGIMVQKSFDTTARINVVSHLALRASGNFRQGAFRSDIGSDEYVFNDPEIGVPGIMFTTHPYPQYHTSFDTPELINYEVMAQVKRAILKTIEYYEKDFIPKRNFKAPLFRSRYGIQSKGKGANLAWDYFIYSMDGRRTFSDLCTEFGLNFEHTLEQVERLIEDKQISRCPIAGKGDIKKTPRKKPKGL